MKKQAEDIALVSQVMLLGSEKAFRRLVEKYQSPVRRFFLNHTGGDEALSDDLAQETFIKAWCNIESFLGLAAFSTWLYRIAYNIWCDYLRGRKEHQSLTAEGIDPLYHCDPDDLTTNYDLYRAMEGLKEEEKSCILLYFMEDLSISRISLITGLPSGTVKSHLSRGKSKMARFLQQQGYDNSQRKV